MGRLIGSKGTDRLKRIDKIVMSVFEMYDSPDQEDFINELRAEGLSVINAGLSQSIFRLRLRGNKIKKFVGYTLEEVDDGVSM